MSITTIFTSIVTILASIEQVNTPFVLKIVNKQLIFYLFFPVRAIKGQEDVTIRVSDQGGGIPRRMTDTIFEYLYTTAPTPQLTSSCDVPNNPGMGMPAPIAGE